ncbi:MAG: polysaccharide lyase [Planctomycetaceae bacterium]|nr:polysaccharide lyase [Planctomycetaceae bacterium]
MKRIITLLFVTFFICTSLPLLLAQEVIPSTAEVKGYKLVGGVTPEVKHIGWKYDALHRDFFVPVGFDYSEHPHSSGPAGHMDGVHLAVIHDEALNKPVFRFDIHITLVIDGDRGSAGDRQRNELKTSHTNRDWRDLLNGQQDKWQLLEWKMMIPKDWQPTPNFCHIHQIKAQDGPNNGSPIITITLRANRDGSNKRLHVEHNSEGGSGRSLGTLAQAPLSEFEDEWVHIEQEMHFRHNGFFSIKITRIRDGKVLLTAERDNIDMYRREATVLRSKHGIYRSLAGGNIGRNVPPNPLLKNESLYLCDFLVYEKEGKLK